MLCIPGVPGSIFRNETPRCACGPLPQRSPRGRSHVRSPQPRHLPGRQVPPHRHPTRTSQSVFAVEHALLIAIWNMLTTGELYNDPGADFYTRLNPDKAKHRAIDQLRKMGYNVTLNPLADAG